MAATCAAVRCGEGLATPNLADNAFQSAGLSRVLNSYNQDHNYYNNHNYNYSHNHDNNPG